MKNAGKLIDALTRAVKNLKKQGKNIMKQNRKFISFHPRRLARNVAKENMKNAGIQRVNRHFSSNWRNYVR